MSVLKYAPWLKEESQGRSAESTRHSELAVAAHAVADGLALFSVVLTRLLDRLMIDFSLYESALYDRDQPVIVDLTPVDLTRIQLTVYCKCDNFIVGPFLPNRRRFIRGRELNHISNANYCFVCISSTLSALCGPLRRH